MKKGKLLAIGGVLTALAGLAYYKKTNKGNNIDADRIKTEDRFRSYYDLTNRWLLLKNEGRNLSEYFEQNGYSNIAMYGMGNLGLRLQEELNGTKTKIEYAIDSKRGKQIGDLIVKSVSEVSKIDDVEVIVVTPIYDFDRIKEEIEKKTDKPIISLNEVVFGL